MERWPGWQAHALEHYAALLQRGIQQHLWLLERHLMAGDERQLAALAVLELGGLTASLLLMRALRVVFGSLATACAAWLTRAARVAPWVVLVALAYYLRRVLRSRLLRDDWRAFLCQWSRSGGEVTCTICCEQVRNNAWHVAKLSCCETVLCWPCMRRHAESVVDDARPEMLCPTLSCRQVLPDTLIATAIKRERWSFGSLDVLGTLMHRKMRAYERWVLMSGLAASCQARTEDVVHCPGRSCNHMWVLPRELRRRKAEEEPQSRWNPRSWFLGRQVGLYAPPMREGSDLRRVRCPGCRLDFCLLCGLNWHLGPSRPTAGSPQAEGCGGHIGKSCMEYSAAFPERRTGEREWAGAKPCPGCNVRILRSMGCNHMTCTQCGGEWCWVCRCRWSPLHYGCGAPGGQEGEARPEVPACCVQ